MWTLGLILLLCGFDEGIDYLNQGEYLKAQQEFKQFLVKFPEDLKIPSALLYLAQLEPDLQAAESLYQVVVLKYPNSSAVPYARLGWAKLCYAQADYPRSISILSRIDPNRVPDTLAAEVLYWLGWAHRAQGDELTSQKIFEQLRQRFPEIGWAQRSHLKRYTVQVGAFRVKDYALSAVNRLSSLGYQAWIEEAWLEGRRYYRVRVGEFDSRDPAQRMCEELRLKGVGGTVVRR